MSDLKYWVQVGDSEEYYGPFDTHNEAEDFHIGTDSFRVLLCKRLPVGNSLPFDPFDVMELEEVEIRELPHTIYSYDNPVSFREGVDKKRAAEELDQLIAQWSRKYLEANVWAEVKQ